MRCPSRLLWRSYPSRRGGCVEVLCGQDSRCVSSSLRQSAQVTYEVRHSDPCGQTTLKAVRFRAQITPCGQGVSPTNPYFPPSRSGCTLSLSQEKGAKSSLEVVALRLRQEWRYVSFRKSCRSRCLTECDYRFDDLFSSEPSPLLKNGSRFAN